ncbi:MAG: rhomboid family intramembrane serine protease [Roseivirga sp.]
MHGTTPVVRRLLLLNIGLFLAQSLLGLDLIHGWGLRSVLSSYFRPYQLLTHLFVHASLSHLVGNMFALFTFGPVLEYTLTSKRLINFYITTGLGAAVLCALLQYFEQSKVEALYRAYLAHPDPESFVVYLHQFSHKTYSTFGSFIAAFFEHADDPAYLARSKAIVGQLYRLKIDTPIIGASGAIFGLLMAFAMLFPNAELFLFFLPLPVKAKYVIAFYGAYELYAGIRHNPADNVAHFAHLGGLLLGYLFIRRWKKRNQY